MELRAGNTLIEALSRDGMLEPQPSELRRCLLVLGAA